MRRFFIGSAAFCLLIFSAAPMPPALSAEEYIYYARGRRDPFIPLISSGVKAQLGLQVVETIEDIRFEGVIFDPFGKSMAMLNGEVISEGEKAYNVEVVKVYNDSVVIKIYDETYTLDLIKEGGETVE